VSLLRSEHQQQTNPLACFRTCLCRQRSGHEWTASSSLHDTSVSNSVQKIPGFWV